MMKSLLSAFLIAIMVSGFALAGVVHFGTVQASTDVTGIIYSDTTWTKANSPYSLTGNVLVYNGVTLTIEAGVTVNLDGYYIMVNGTLRARGSGTDKIHFNSGEITFTQYSNSWNEQTSSGCIFENANLNATSISSDISLKINNVYTNAPISVVESCIISNSLLAGKISVGNSSIISNSSFTGGISVGNSSVITDNTITCDVSTGNLVTIANNNINGSVISGSSSIVNNTITGTVTIRESSSDSSVISNNTLAGGGTAWEFLPFVPVLIPRYAMYPRSVVDVAGGTVVISNNTITSQGISAQVYGIEVPESSYDGGYGITTQANCNSYIHNNVISGGFVRGINVVGPGIIQNNSIVGNSGGVAIGKRVYDYGLLISEGDVTIRDNILANSEVGIGGFVVNSYYGEVDYYATAEARTVTIERNVIVGSQNGIDVVLQAVTQNIQNNTITDSSVAITLTSCPSATINFNNIQDYTQRSITLASTSVDINATYNWWGTTNTTLISQSIYDFWDDFNLGKVTFVPFLTEPNPEAMPIPEFLDTTSPTISIISPENKAYAVTNVSLTFTVNETASWIGYSLDGQANATIIGNTTLNGLSDGFHNLTVYATDIFGNIGSSVRVHFTIDTTLPSISILSPENKTYGTTDIPLNFTVNEPVSWMGYSLDGQANATLSGNTTLTGLSDGTHSLVVYAKDTVGNTGTSETIYFGIEPFPTLIAAAIVIAAVVGIALLVYFAKVRKTTKEIQ